MYMIDLPFSAASAAPSGVNTPWLMALLRNSTLPGSTRIDTRPSRWWSISQLTPSSARSASQDTEGPIAHWPKIAITAPMMPALKLSTSISNPGRILPSISPSHSLTMYAAAGPISIAPRNIGTSAPTTTPTVATAATTAPRWPCTSRPPV